MKSRRTSLAMASVLSFLVMIAAVVLAMGGSIRRWQPTLFRYQFEYGGVLIFASSGKLVVMYRETLRAGDQVPRTYEELRIREPHMGHIRFLGIEIAREGGVIDSSKSGKKAGVDMLSYIRFPFWLIILLSAILPAIWFFRFRARTTQRRKEMGFCLTCGYDLRASKDRCPECGRAIEPENPGMAKEVFPSDLDHV